MCQCDHICRIELLPWRRASSPTFYDDQRSVRVGRPIREALDARPEIGRETIAARHQRQFLQTTPRRILILVVVEVDGGRRQSVA